MTHKLYSSVSVTKRNHIGPMPKLWLILFVVSTLVLLAGGYAVYLVEKEGIRREKYDVLAAIAKVKAEHIREWRQERLDDARAVARRPLFQRALEAWLQNRKDTRLRATVLEWLAEERESKGLANVALLDTDGRVLLSAKPQTDSLDPVEKRAINESLAKHAPVLSDLYRSPQGTVQVDAVAPALDLAGRPMAVVLLRSRAESVLYPLIQSWPTPSDTAETLLVRRDGEDVLFLNNLRHWSDTALSLHKPLTRLDLPAVQAVLGKEDIFQGKDYRGVEVLADLRRVPDSPWFVVAKVDRSEILAEARYHGGMIALFCGLFILLAATVTAYGYRRRQVGLYQELYRADREQRETQEHFRTILYSIGDAVITTDNEGLVKQMNPVAERLTGWAEPEAKGRPLDEIFHIIDEKWRTTVESLVPKVIHEGTVIGRPHHTLLTAQNGSEVPIAYSGAPIRDEGGAIIGIVVVFRDHTAERKSQRELEESEERYRTVADHTYDWELWTTPDEHLAYCSPSCERVSGYRAEEYLRDPSLLGRIVHPDDQVLWEQHISQVAHSSDKCELDYRIISRTGEVVWIAHCCTPVHSIEGKFGGRRASNRDITERKRAEKALREARNNLEIRVRERTAELENANRILQQEMIERRRAEEAVTAERQQLYDILETMPIIVCLLTPDHRVAFANRSFREKFGEDTDRHCFDLVFDSKEPCEFCEAYSVLKTGKPHHWEVTGADGSIFDVYSSPLVDTEGSPFILELAIDITERKEVEKLREKALETAEIITKIFSTTHFGIVLLDREFNFIEVNQAYADACGYRPDFFPGKNHFDLYPHEENESIFRQVVETGETFTVYSKPFEFPDDPERGVTYWDWTLHPVEDSQGRVEALILILLEVTERKRAEEERAKAAKEIEDLYNNAPCGYHSLDANGMFVRINDTELSWLGYTREEMVGKMRFQDLITSETLKIFEEDYPRFMERGWVKDLEFDLIRRDGAILPVLLSATAVKDSSGKFVMSRSTIFDIRHRKLAEENLRRANRALGVLSECNRLLVRATDEQGFLDDICRVLVDHGGYRMAWIGFALQDAAKTVNPVAIAGFEDDYLQSAKITWSDDETGRGPTGTAIRTGITKTNRNSWTNPEYNPWRSEAWKRGYASSIALPLIDNNGIFGALTIYSSQPNAFDDEETKLLDQLADEVSYGIASLKMRAEKEKADLALRETLTDLRRSNEDLQQFAYVASHDLQEPLRNVASCLQILEKKYKNELDADADKLMGYAVEGALRMKALIQDLLAYSRVATRGKPLRQVNCEQVLDQTVKNLRVAISEAEAVITCDRLPTIRADDTQLPLVFQNLIQNAIKFRKDEPPRVHVSASKSKNEWIFSVQDNGIGIESEYLDRIFVIFQRLHNRSRYGGTGMGLAIVKKVVERHGGRIWAESELGVGTRFYFAIPERGMGT
jgi:PAS domain S-box-containing protein